VVHKPKRSKGYYGNIVAAPVFKRIAQKIYTDTPIMDELPSLEVESEAVEKDFEKYYTKVQNEKVLMPNVKGMPAMDAIPLLENLGLKVQVNGDGIVKSQSITAGQKIKSNQKVNLKLS